VREGLDRVLVVRYDEESGAATVTTGGPSTKGGDSSVRNSGEVFDLAS
jgi:hypothetical protein